MRNVNSDDINEFFFLKEIIKKYGDSLKNNYIIINNKFYSYERIIERYNELMEELLEDYEIEEDELKEDDSDV